MYIKKTTGYVLPLNRSVCQTLTDTGPNYSAISEVYVKKMSGHVVANDIEKGLLDVYYPPTGQSNKWKHWVTVFDLKRCYECRSRQGRIFAIHEEPAETPPLHPNCRCKIEVMEATIAGTATKDGEEGADYRTIIYRSKKQGI